MPPEYYMLLLLLPLLITTVISTPYLHIAKFLPSCEDIIETSNFDSVEKAVKECDSKSFCTFVVRDSANGIYLCKSHSLGEMSKDTNSDIFIKPGKLYKSSGKRFLHIMNHRGICDESQLVGEDSLVGSLEYACEKCKALGCDYLTISTASGLGDNEDKYRNHVWYCRGYPKYVPKDGFITSINQEIYDYNLSNMVYNGPLH